MSSLSTNFLHERRGAVPTVCEIHMQNSAPTVFIQDMHYDCILHIPGRGENSHHIRGCIVVRDPDADKEQIDMRVGCDGRLTRGMSDA
jgi:hypothetical protein